MRSIYTTVSLIVILGFVPAAHAEEHGDRPPETMQVVTGSSSDEGDYVEQIALPADASDVAREEAAFGLDTANRARALGREFGQSVAGNARALAGDARLAEDRADPDTPRPGRP